MASESSISTHFPECCLPSGITLYTLSREERHPPVEMGLPNGPSKNGATHARVARGPGLGLEARELVGIGVSRPNWFPRAKG